MLAASLNAFFCASPIYGSAEDFTLSAELYALRERNTSCEAANRRNEKKALSAATSFFPFRLPLRGLKGASSPFLVDPARRNRWWFSGSLLARKRELSLRNSALPPRHRRENPFKVPSRTHPAPPGSGSIYSSPGTFPRSSPSAPTFALYAHRGGSSGQIRIYLLFAPGRRRLPHTAFVLLPAPYRPPRGRPAAKTKSTMILSASSSRRA